MAFFTTAVTGLKTVVTAIGAGVGVWGVRASVNLLFGVLEMIIHRLRKKIKGGLTQLMSGWAALIIVAQTCKNPSGCPFRVLSI